MGVRVYALSTDPPEKLEGFQEKLGEGVTLLADPAAKATKAWGMLDKTPFPKRGIARAGTFYVDARGVLSSRWLPTHYHSRPDADEILAALR